MSVKLPNICKQSFNKHIDNIGQLKGYCSSYLNIYEEKQQNYILTKANYYLLEKNCLKSFVCLRSALWLSRLVCHKIEVPLKSLIFQKYC